MPMSSMVAYLHDSFDHRFPRFPSPDISSYIESVSVPGIGLRDPGSQHLVLGPETIL